jgi:acyl-CoA synthetase (AMP-forming)/AMP-acid ligase II
MYDESAAAFVVLGRGASLDADELIARCTTRLANFKVPTRVDVVAAVPRTPEPEFQKQIVRAGAQQSAERVMGPRRTATGRPS